MTVSRNLVRKKLPFDARISVEDCGHSTPCHVWQGNIADTGYGRHGENGKMWLAHRYAYVRAHGDIPDDLTIDHLCRNRPCVNPEHLEPVTRAENTRREMQAVPPRKGPRCEHEIQPGWKNCRICARARRAAYRDRLEAKFGVRKMPGGFRGHRGRKD